MAGSSTSLSAIEIALHDQPDKPPLHLWHPELSGDIDIRIAANGDWFHLGGKIERLPLVKLFSTILRREGDGEYYLVTPLEKWRIQVEQTALLIIDMDVLDKGLSNQRVVVTSNVGEKYMLGEHYLLQVTTAETSNEPFPVVTLDNGLTARVSRAVFYRMVDCATEREGGHGLLSGCHWFQLEGN
ncbi:DUF1285 domain-containing protein [Oceanicoccus sp. KOV_DT_Chl]|uniref:DUF1285 domain-containing protein n=1 Tax=Oceanicoccus sp. KOV_DT_Chl TaxID=1904639 RepID=UPI000C7BC25D|nr:DUF1285 domain-containing protein [Oceanicoccus sp. KOV_DT_Chl]